MPPALVRRVLEHATGDTVLIGGQALAWWMAFYDIPPTDLRAPAISRDVDFFTASAANRAPLARFADAIGGTAHPRDAAAITALVGHAEAPAADGRIYNVDLVHAVVGLTRERVDANAVPVRIPGIDHPVRIMHPLDVLASRTANLHQLREKQDEIGRMQCELAIRVARAYLESRIDASASTGAAARDRAFFDEIGVVDDLSRTDAAKKNAERWDVYVADAIPAWRIAVPAFWKKQWPHVRARMSDHHAAECERLRRETVAAQSR